MDFSSTLKSNPQAKTLRLATTQIRVPWIMPDYNAECVKKPKKKQCGVQKEKRKQKYKIS